MNKQYHILTKEELTDIKQCLPSDEVTKEIYGPLLRDLLRSVDGGIVDIIWGPDLEFIPIQPNNQIEGWDGWSLNAYPQELINEQKSS